MNEFLTWADDRLLVAMWDAALKGTLLLALAGVAALAVRRASAATRHLVWSAALVGALLLPVLSLLLPEWRVPWMPQWLGAETLMAADEGVAQHSGEFATIEPMPAPIAGSESLSPAESPPTLASADFPSFQVDVRGGAPNGSDLQPTNKTPINFGQFAVVVWSVGLVASLLPLVVGTTLLARFTRRCARCDDSAWVEQVSKLSERVGLRRRVSLRIGEGVRSPLTWGAWRPVLLLPAAANDWPADRRRVVLLHELAHVKRFDWLTQSLAYVACSIYWFNPLAWWAARRMRVEREAACDDAVLAAGSRPTDYADELLRLASAIMQRRLVDWAAVPMARHSTLEGRLLAILDGTRNRRAVTRTIVAAAVVLLAAVAVPVAMMRAAPAPAEPRFGPVIERVIRYAQTSNVDTNLDLDSGEFVKGEFDIRDTNARRSAGVDLFVIQRMSRLTLVTALDLWTQRLTAAEWDALTTDRLRELRDQANVARQHGVVTREALLEEGTYAFSTDKTFGLLQVRGATAIDGDDRNGVLVRCKVLQTAADESAAKPPGEQANERTRKFVRVVVGPGALTFEGQSTTWEQLPELLAQVPDRGRTVLELAVSSDSYNMGQLAELQVRTNAMARQLGFEYLSFIGVHPLGSKGTAAGMEAPAQTPPAAEAAARLRERIERLIEGAPDSTRYPEIEVFELVPGTRSEYRIRAIVLRRKVLPAGGSLPSVPLGEVLYLKDNNRFYVQWDAAGASTLHYYGPFEGDPAEVLDFPVPALVDEAANVAPVRLLVRQWLDLAAVGDEEAAGKLAYANGEFIGEVFRHPALVKFAFDQTYVNERAALVTSKPFKDAQGQQRIFLIHVESRGTGDPASWRIHGGTVADPDEARELIGAFTAPPIVGKVVERTLHKAKNELLDLDSGKTYSVSVDWEQTVDDPLKWVGERGIDVTLGMNPNFKDQLVGLTGVFAANRVENDQWEGGDRRSVSEALGETRIKATLHRVDDQPLPVTFAFRTTPVPTGRTHVGLLQILALDQDEKKVSIRYRLFAED